MHKPDNDPLVNFFREKNEFNTTIRRSNIADNAEIDVFTAVIVNAAATQSQHGTAFIVCMLYRTSMFVPLVIVHLNTEEWRSIMLRTK